MCSMLNPGAQCQENSGADKMYREIEMILRLKRVHESVLQPLSIHVYLEQRNVQGLEIYM